MKKRQLKAEFWGSIAVGLVVVSFFLVLNQFAPAPFPKYVLGGTFIGAVGSLLMHLFYDKDQSITSMKKGQKAVAKY